MIAELTEEQLAERLFWQRSSPFVRTLAIEIETLDGVAATMRVRPLPRLAAIGSRCIDPLVLPGLIDDCLSLSIGQGLPPDQGIATLDLWFATLRSPIEGDVVATARRIVHHGSVATSTVEVRDDMGVVLHGGGSFILGHYPSGGIGDPTRAGRYDPTSLVGPFRRSMGIAEEGDAISMTGSDAVVGWEAGPVIHGGAVAAALYAAAQRTTSEGQRVTSMAIRYLRPAAHRGLTTISRVDRFARRATHLSVEALVENRMVATATAVAA